MKLLYDGTPSLKGRKWVLKEGAKTAFPKEFLDEFSKAFSSLLTQHPLIKSKEELDLFLTPKIVTSLPDPSHLIDMDKATNRLLEAIQNKETIGILGDYDVDGATSSAAVLLFLEKLGASSAFHIPDRITEGYGPSLKGIQKLQRKGCSVILTLDCGSTSFEPLSFAKKEGLDVIVIDHHLCPEKLPEAHSLINPNRRDESSSFTYLCAAGVTFLFLISLRRALLSKGLFQEEELPNLLSYLDLVALGTVCDVVPLKGLNRAFVSQGLKILSQTQNIGLQSLAKMAGIIPPYRAYDLGFVLGPRINAGGRVGDSTLGTNLLTTKDRKEADQIATRLCMLNEERQRLEQQALSEAEAQATENIKDPYDLKGICVYSKNWHPGIIGIVAGRLKEKYACPVFVFSLQENGAAKGSARSIPSFHLGDFIEDALKDSLLQAGGGHALAAGATIITQDLPRFQEAFLKACDRTYSPPILEITSLLSPNQIDINFAKEVEILGPFGAGNAAPRFCLSNCKIIAPKIVGESHIKFFIKNETGPSLPAISFRSMETPLDSILEEAHFKSYHIAGTVSINEWNDRQTVQLIVDDILEP